MGFDSAARWKMTTVTGVENEKAKASVAGRRPVRNGRPSLMQGLVATAVIALLALYAVLAFTATLTKGPSFDETLQLAVGYNAWRHSDYRVEGANGDLVKRWATLPYLVSKPKFLQRSDATWKQGSGYDLGHAFFFESGNRPESLLRQARAMNVLLGVATGFMIYWCAHVLFGAAGGLVSLTLFAFSPAMLALGGIVSTDMSITLTLLLATCCAWRLLHTITFWRLAGSLMATGLLVLAKPSALVIFPITAVLIAAKLVHGGPLRIKIGATGWAVMSRKTQAACFALLLGLHVVAGWSAIWAHYGFRYAASPHPNDGTIEIYQPMTSDQVPDVIENVIQCVQRERLLPEGFWRGIEALVQCDDGLGAFMAGRWRVEGGWAWFFPYAIWVKSTPSLFLLLVGGAVAWWLAWRQSEIPATGNGVVGAPAIYGALPHFALIGCYLAVAMTEDINIGHRHALPIYPSLYVLAGAAMLAWKWKKLIRIGIAAALGWHAVESCAVRPHYLAYFGPQTGGPDDGYKRLVDSSLDWGMNLPELKRWLDKHNPQGRERLFLSYFGTDRPSHYGIRAIRLPSFTPRRTFQRYPLGPGYYAISASMLQGVHTAAFGPWCKDYEELYQRTLRSTSAYDLLSTTSSGRAELLRHAPRHAWNADYDLFDELRFARLCAWLRHRGDPPHHVGHALFIWKLSTDDLRAALLGPPAELVNTPGRLRLYRYFVPSGAQPAQNQSSDANKMTITR